MTQLLDNYTYQTFFTFEETNVLNTQQIISLGLGRQSTAVAILNAEGKIKNPTMKAIFADTGGEHSYTYEFLENSFKPYCEKVGLELVVVQRKEFHKEEFNETLEEYCLHHNMIPSSFNRWCTILFKLEPIYRYILKEQGLAVSYKTLNRLNDIVITLLNNRLDAGYTVELGGLATQYTDEEIVKAAYDALEAAERKANKPVAKTRRAVPFELIDATRILANTVSQVGIATEEAHRARHTDPTKRYPLLELGLNTDACKGIIRKAGLPVPGKSGCFYCCFMTKDNVKQQELAHPELNDKAINMEQNAKSKKNPDKRKNLMMWGNLEDYVTKLRSDSSTSSEESENEKDEREQEMKCNTLASCML